jgi:hypothetical protein
MESDKKKKDKKEKIAKPASNADFEGEDKAPGEEQGIAEKVTTRDLKDKTVDADPEEDNKK